MNKWHFGIKLLALILTVFLATPLNLVEVLAAESSTKIQHKPPEDYVPGFRINLDAQIKDDNGLIVSRCYFKAKEAKNFVFVEMAPKGNPTYLASLPAPWVNSEEIHYVIVAVNKQKQVTRSQVFIIKERETKEATSWKEPSEVKNYDVELPEETVVEYEGTKKELNQKYAGTLPPWQTAAAAGSVIALSELPTDAKRLPGFYDDVKIKEVPPEEKYGLKAQELYTQEQIESAGSAAILLTENGVTSGGIVEASEPGGGTNWVAVGAGVAAGAAALGLAAAGGGGGSSGGGSSGGGGGGSSSEPPESVTGTWNFRIRCQAVPDTTIISLDIPINEGAGGDFSGSGTGTDTNGDQLNITISGNYNATTRVLQGQIDTLNLTNPGPARIDLFSTTLTSNDTGWIPTTCTQNCACVGEIRLVKIS
jgi:hypothetical protein